MADDEQSSEHDVDAVIRQLAAYQSKFQMLHRAGLITDAQLRSHEAKVSGFAARLDELRGIAGVTYEEFHAAFEAGADCEVLIELKNGMDPKDPRKEEANEALRSVGCYNTGSSRRAD